MSTKICLRCMFATDKCKSYRTRNWTEASYMPLWLHEKGCDGKSYCKQEIDICVHELDFGVTRFKSLYRMQKYARLKRNVSPICFADVFESSDFFKSALSFQLFHSREITYDYREIARTFRQCLIYSLPVMNLGCKIWDTDHNAHVRQICVTYYHFKHKFQIILAFSPSFKSLRRLWEKKTTLARKIRYYGVRKQIIFADRCVSFF